MANELGAGNGKGARFATIVAVMSSAVIGLVFFVVVMILHDKLAYIFTNSSQVIHAVDKLAALLAFSILLNSVQPVLSGNYISTKLMLILYYFLQSIFIIIIINKIAGVAVGSGWQAIVAYVNIGTYYLIGIPLGIFLGWYFKLGVMVYISSINFPFLIFDNFFFFSFSNITK